ncbi:MAG: rod-binding protein [Planctomycetota bacterium]
MSAVPISLNVDPSIASAEPRGATDKAARLRKAATGLEGLWIHQMLKEALPKGGMLERSFAAETFQDMLSDALAQNMAQRSKFGLADVLVKQLEPKVAAQPAATNGLGEARNK